VAAAAVADPEDPEDPDDPNDPGVVRGVTDEVELSAGGGTGELAQIESDPEGRVLGATTLADTGSHDQIVAMLFLILGSGLVGISLFRYVRT